jgi:hypothetical protein
LDEHLLEEVTRASGERTYSRAVTKALEDYLRRHRAGRILELAGSGMYSAYQGLRLGYRVQLEQDGDRITGRGQKWSESGRQVSAGARSPIILSGRIDGRHVTLQYTERGARRATSGSFSFNLSPDGDALRGSFSSTAADASGGSVARKMR